LKLGKRCEEVDPLAAVFLIELAFHGLAVVLHIHLSTAETAVRVKCKEDLAFKADCGFKLRPRPKSTDAEKSFRVMPRHRPAVAVSFFGLNAVANRERRRKD